ncbi:MAG: glycosyltransferase family 4 protein [Desulfovibrio sp.]
MNEQGSRRPHLRFAFLTSNYYPVDRVQISILFFKEIPARNYSIDFFLQSAQDEDHFRILPLERNIGRVLLAPMRTNGATLSRIRKRIYDFFNDFRIFGQARSNRYDFIQVRDKFVSGLLGLLAARLNRTRFIYWMTYPFPESDLESVRQGITAYPTLYRLRAFVNGFLLYRVLLPRADHVFAQSEQMKCDLIEKGIDAKKITPMPMAVADHMIPERPTQDEIDDQCVAYLGTMARIRRLDFLIRAFALVLKQRPCARLLMIGDGYEPEDMRELRQLVSDLNIADRVEFTGQLPIEAALARVRTALVCLSPLYPSPIFNPASPTKLVEYLAMSRAAVVTDHPEQRLVIEQSHGGICTPYDETAFAEGILTLLADPETAKRMGRDGREYVLAHRTYSIAADRTDAVYREVCGAEAEK